jgi:hypothetical protein
MTDHLSYQFLMISQGYQPEPVEDGEPTTSGGRNCPTTSTMAVDGSHSQKATFEHRHQAGPHLEPAVEKEEPKDQGTAGDGT